MAHADGKRRSDVSVEALEAVSRADGASDRWPVAVPMMELVRQEWLSWHHRRFALAVSRLPSMRGESKTMRAIREEGLMAGLQGAHARMLIALQRTQPTPHVDPLLPHAPGVEEKDTRKELVAAGVDVASAVRLATDMADDMAAAARACAAAHAALTASTRAPAADVISVVHVPAAADGAGVTMLALVFTPAAADVAAWLEGPARDAAVPDDRRFGPVKKPVYAHTAALAPALASAGLAPTAHTSALPITHAHLRKLALLHVLTVAGVHDPAALSPRHSDLLADLRAACQPLPAGRSVSDVQAAFLRRAWCVLARYEVFTGNAAGLQGAVTHEAFDALQALLGVEGECFASPLNSHFPAYCSAFPDTDGPFGSRGSFHNWSPASGCYEANPPFVNDTMLAMAKRLGELLDAAGARGGALAFYVVVPAWSDAYFHKLLAARARRHATLRRKEHDFLDGAQYRAARATWAANVDTSVFLLATDAAVAAGGWGGAAGAKLWARVVAAQGSAAGGKAGGVGVGESAAATAAAASAGAGAVATPSRSDAAGERRVFQWPV